MSYAIGISYLFPQSVTVFTAAFHEEKLSSRTKVIAMSVQEANYYADLCTMIMYLLYRDTPFNANFTLIL